MKIAPETEKIDTKEILRYGPLFIIPLAVLLFFLIIRYPVSHAMFWATIAIIVTALFLNLISKEIRRDTLSEWKQRLGYIMDGVKLGAEIGVVCACLGMMVAVLVWTGLVVKLPGGIVAWSGGYLGIILVLAMVVSILLGTGLPGAVAYVLVAMCTAPALVAMGLSVLQAHFFAWYFAVFSYITPPVALAALFASRLSGGSYLKTAVEAMKAGLAGFILPYFLIACPFLLLQPQSSLPLIMIDVVTMLLLIVSFQTGFVGYYLTELKLYHRVIAITSAALLIAYLFTSYYVLLIVGVGLFLVLTFWQYRERKIARSSHELSMI